MTLVVLGIDALDPDLVEAWDLEYAPLDDFGEMETYAHTKDLPLTPEVWPTIATGLGPKEHGITEENTSGWDNPFVDFASNYTWFLDFATRGTLGDIAHKLTGADHHIPETDADSFFDGPGRLVHDWPGVENSQWLRDVWATGIPEDGKTEEEFERDVLGLAVQQFAWVEEMVAHPSTLVATHTHVLDMAGHVYAEDEEKLRSLYEWTDDWIGRVLAAMSDEDEMLILSDHGIVTPNSPDGDLDYGEHSWRAFSSSTGDSRPNSVFDVYDWVESHVDDEYDPGTIVDLPEEQLRDLGYI